MDWFKVESSVYDHPKIDELTAPAFRTLVFTWAFCARHETGGHLPARSAKRLGMTPKLAAELEAAGLLHANGDGWHVHDWHDHQAEAEALIERRRKDAERKRQARTGGKE